MEVDPVCKYSGHKIRLLRSGKRISILALLFLSVLAVFLQPAFSQSNDTMKGMSVPSAASGAEGIFLQAMVPHHEMAIEMARMAAQKAKNPIIKSMANEIIRAQSEEIEKIKAIHQRLFGSELTPNKMAHEGLGLTMEQSGMTMDMKTLEKATNFDKLFVERMTIHHLGAIKMARKALETTTDAEIRKLAEAIIEAQTKEIETLKTIR